MPDDILAQSVRDFIAATAAKTPTPGGGSVAALAGALAASLAEMSLNYTVDKKQFASVRDQIAGAIEQLRRASGLMQELVYEDIAAYGALSEALKIPKDQRASDPRYLPAVVAAIAAPQSIAGVALHVLELAHGFLDKCNPYLVSDLGAAAALACGVVHVAEFNVRVNTRLLPNAQEAEDTRQRLAELSAKADALWQGARAILLTKL